MIDHYRKSSYSGTQVGSDCVEVRVTTREGAQGD